MKSILFVFTGTGNSLWAAKEIANELDDCAIVSMGRRQTYPLTETYDRIGFVYPTYYRGVPAKVRQFVSQLQLGANQNAYFFAVATCGGAAHAGNSISQLAQILEKKGVSLHYGKQLGMFPNYVVLYDMRQTVQEEAAQSAQNLQPMLQQIKQKTSNVVPKKNKFLDQLGYRLFMHYAPRLDQKFSVSDACVQCGICKKVCPAENIVLGEDGRPQFQHHCEQCLSCLHNCPARAINYKDKTQNRRRYHHPAVTWQDLAKLNHEI
ncbi:MAG TPA: 4Fe-4S ferredoxin [Ruminococcaceae bacterium]|nr:4Fe-4S ferredoxin [Oscillospiraceae bacterium]